MSSTQMTCSHFRKNRPKKRQKPAGCRSRIISKNRPVPIFGRSTGASLILIFWMCLFNLNVVVDCCFFWLWCSFSQGILKKEGHNFIPFLFFYFCFDIFFCVVFNSHSFGDAVQLSHQRHRIQELRLQLWHERKSNGKRLMSPWTFLCLACCILPEIILVTKSATEMTCVSKSLC